MIPKRLLRLQNLPHGARFALCCVIVSPESQIEQTLHTPATGLHGYRYCVVLVPIASQSLDLLSYPSLLPRSEIADAGSGGRISRSLAVLRRL